MDSSTDCPHVRLLFPRRSLEARSRDDSFACAGRSDRGGGQQSLRESSGGDGEMRDHSSEEVHFRRGRPKRHHRRFAQRRVPEGDPAFQRGYQGHSERHDTQAQENKDPTGESLRKLCNSTVIRLLILPTSEILRIYRGIRL